MAYAGPVFFSGGWPASIPYRGHEGYNAALGVTQESTAYAVRDVLEGFRARAEEHGIGYQTLISLALREHLHRRPVDEETLRRILREELPPAV